MIWSAASFVVAAFLILLQLLGVPRRAGIVVQRSKEALQVVRDRSLAEEQKETAIQAHAKALFGQFFAITGATVVAMAVPVAIVYALELLGVVGLEQVLDRTLSWQILVGATVAGLAVWQVLRRRG